MKKKISILITIAVILLGAIIVLFFHPDNALKKNNLNNDIAFLTKLAEQGDMKAQTDLGTVYVNKKSPDYTKAIYWYNKAAQQNYAPAQFNLGLIHAHGEGGIKDLKRAREYYYKAASQGFASAQINLGGLLINGIGGNIDYDQALDLFTKAAKSNNPVAMYNLGHIYHSGLGRPKDDIQAARWYIKAADLGSIASKNSLALFYAQGLGNLPVDKDKAFKLLKDSASQGYAVAQNNLGILYSDGTDETPQNYIQSYAWFSVAFYNGHQEADASRKLIMQKLKGSEIEKAKVLSTHYEKKYTPTLNNNGTNKLYEH
jgi:TPR repeat protein